MMSHAHTLLRNGQGIFHNNANVSEKWRLRDTINDIPSCIYSLSLHFVPSLQFAFCN